MRRREDVIWVDDGRFFILDREVVFALGRQLLKGVPGVVGPAHDFAEERETYGGQDNRALAEHRRLHTAQSKGTVLSPQSLT